MTNPVVVEVLRGALVEFRSIAEWARSSMRTAEL